MILEEIVNINQGIPLNRIRLKKAMERQERFVYSFEEESKIQLPKNIKEADQHIPLVKEDMILLNITSYNAKIAEIEDLGKVVSSNYMTIEVKNPSKVDPDYLEWYLDKSESFKREIYKIKQGSLVRSIPINEFRKLNIKLPDIEFQRTLGKINKLEKKKKELFKERQDLLKSSLITINEEAIING